MRSAVLIANPSASQFTGGLFRDVVTALSSSYDLTTQWPVSGTDTMRHSEAAAEAGIGVVFAMGGDGVAHHVANGIAGTSTSLGLIPAGTTNVLARILGIPQKPRQAALAATEYVDTPTRVAKITGTSLAGPIDRVATFSVGVGFDAAVVEAAERRPYAKLRFGGVYYASTALGRLTSDWRTRLPNLRIEAGGETYDALAALTQVHDPYTYFGRIPLHLVKDPPRGMATLGVGRLGYRNATTLVSRAVLRRQHTERSGTHLWTDYDRISILADPPAPFQADGELLGTATEVTIEPIDDGLLILRPKAEQPDVELGSQKDSASTDQHSG
ncbi:MAG: diacylglycerol kinase family protein [Actinomycetota bacterium]|nr:diacylglycerol kinase family protein [Actinomycetota bacterium]